MVMKLLDRLRKRHAERQETTGGETTTLYGEAADEIERLQAEVRTLRNTGVAQQDTIERLRRWLRQLVDACDAIDKNRESAAFFIPGEVVEAARAELRPESTKDTAKPADRAYPEKTFDQIVAEAMNQPSLADSVTHACIWEAERAIRQAERNQFSDWETCFNYVVRRVVHAWTEKES